VAGPGDSHPKLSDSTDIVVYYKCESSSFMKEALG